MKTCKWLIIDGYSLMHQDPDSHPVASEHLENARHNLVRKLESITAHMADRITVVFDGRGKGGGDGFMVSPLEIIYSPSDKTADTVIEQLVASYKHPRDITVVSSDSAVRMTVTASGAAGMPSRELLELEDRQRPNALHQRLTRKKPTRGPTLGDFFPGTLIEGWKSSA